jgi:hypothetical protein
MLGGGSHVEKAERCTAAKRILGECVLGAMGNECNTRDPQIFSRRGLARWVVWAPAWIPPIFGLLFVLFITSWVQLRKMLKVPRVAASDSESRLDQRARMLSALTEEERAAFLEVQRARPWWMRFLRWSEDGSVVRRATVLIFAAGILATPIVVFSWGFERVGSWLVDHFGASIAFAVFRTSRPCC